MPAYVVVAKLIPDEIESSMYAILKGIQACSALVYGRLLGAAIGAAISKNPAETDNPNFLVVLLCTCFVTAFILIFFLKLIPTQDEVIAA